MPGGAINDKMPDGVSLFRYPTGYRKHAIPGGVINDLPGGVIHDLHTDIRRGIAFNNLMAERASHSASHATPSKGYKGSCTTGSTSIHKPSIPETESYERQEVGFHL